MENKMQTAPVPPAVPTVAEKVKIQAQLTETAGYLVQVFGQQKAAQMLRSAAAMVAPERQPRAKKAK